jgi:sensor histidine kinase YesM
MVFPIWSAIPTIHRKIRGIVVREPHNGHMRNGRNIVKVILRILAIAGAGLLPALFEWGLRMHDILPDAEIGVCYAASIGTIGWTVLPRTVGPILKFPPFAKWITLIALITAMAAVGGLIAMLLAAGLHIIPVQRFWQLYLNNLRITIVLTLAFTLSSLFHAVLTNRLNRVTAELKAKEAAEERLRQVATEARLSSLESRIHPHFFFNTLNSISALIRENPVEAERMIERLAALLRFSLDSSGARLVPLSRELAIVRSYLEIEKVRFGNRLSYHIEVDPALDGLEVPPLSVQTLVENSVKFAVSPRREGADIIVRAALRNGKHAIDVIDNGPGFSLADVKAGHGLDLLQSRLEAQFGSRSALEFGSDADLTRVTVLI